MKLNAQNWRLPAPPKGEEVEWHPVVRVGRTIPFGYKQDPDDKDILLPIPEELEALEEAKKYLTQFSYRQVADWLTKKTGRAISHVGLMKRIKLESRNKQRASNARAYARRAEEARQKAEKLEGRLGGSQTRSGPSEGSPAQA